MKSRTRSPFQDDMEGTVPRTRRLHVVPVALPEGLVLPEMTRGCSQCEYLSKLYVGYRRMPEGAPKRGMLMGFALGLWREHEREHG
ncbi:hypothetical protein [Streptomyces cacaoi]|uniref:hypothetical protein n=1 Tax=Streptomyces cacaoi TaxID=1898 RepID=UPI00374A642C